MSDISEMFTYLENKDKKWNAIGLTAQAGKYEGAEYQVGEGKGGERYV